VGDVVDAAIVAIDANGDGVAIVGGRRVSVPFTMPGERARIRLPALPPPEGPFRAALVEVTAPSPHRVPPGCRHFGPQPSRTPPCGGCAWQHIAYPEQLRLKTQAVDAVLREAVPGAPAARPMLSATPDRPWGYRHKVHFVFGESGAPPGQLAMGHLARGSRRLVPVVECPVHAEAGNAAAFALRDAGRRAGVRGWEPNTRTRAALRGVAVRVGHATGETLATIVVAHDRDRDLRSATRRAFAVGSRVAPSGLHLNVHQRDDGLIFGPSTRRLTGSDRLRDEVAGVSFLISPTAFFQTNVAAAELLVRLVLEAVPADVPVLDLYAGAGLFALPLARRGHLVHAVEESREAVADGQASQRLNRIPEHRCQWTAAPVESAGGRLRAAGAVILDPPREGCAPGVLEQLFRERGPSTAVYVSCNPETLGRDLAAIVQHGYAVESVQPVDMFPHTPHIETVVVLRPAPGWG
jgi:23S rRNA (uracil1939-C5)-methyltransferase